MSAKSKPTYEQFQKKSLFLQRLYIRREQRRMKRAWQLWCDYKAAMLAIGLHPLTWLEIEARESELRMMWVRAEETHGDHEGMRIAYDMRYGEPSLPSDLFERAAGEVPFQ